MTAPRRRMGRRALCALGLAAAFALGGTPASAERWVPVGPPGGAVRALAADPRDPRRIFLGTGEGVLYRSDDGGRRWNRLEPGFPKRGASLDEIVVDPAGAVVVGYWNLDGRGGGVARSADGGTTFAALAELEGESVRALALAPSDPRVIAAGTLSGAFLSPDGGRTWKRITPKGHRDLRDVESLAFDPRDPRVLYAGTRHLGWKTLDGGGGWTPIHRGMIDDSHVMTLTVDPRDPATVYATACTGIYRSPDGAMEWIKIEGIPESSRRTRAFHLGDAGLLLAGTTEGLWISEDRGRTWRCATSRDVVVNAVLMVEGTIVLGTENRGVLRSSDRGRTWVESNAGFSERFVSQVVFDRAGGRVLLAVTGDAGHGGVFSAPSLAGPWTMLGEGLAGRQVLALEVLGAAIVAGTDAGLFARAAGAQGWTRLPLPPERGGDDLRVTALLAPAPGHLVAVTSHGVLRTEDGGRSWSPPALAPPHEVTAFAASSHDPDVMVAATRLGFFRSSDRGRSWTPVTPGLKGARPHAIAFMPSDHRVLLATTTRGLYRSADQGATWHRVNGGIPHSDLTGLAIHPEGRVVYASEFSHGGVFRSLDAGATWTRVPIEGLACERVWALGFDPAAPDRLVAAAAAGGLHLLAPARLESDAAAALPGK